MLETINELRSAAMCALLKNTNLKTKIMKQAIEIIKEERLRQINIEGWSKEHDSNHVNGELKLAAECYHQNEENRIYQAVSFFYNDYKLVPVNWPWEREFWKPSPDDRIKELKKAGALYMAHEEATGENMSRNINKVAQEIEKLINK